MHFHLHLLVNMIAFLQMSGYPSLQESSSLGSQPHGSFHNGSFPAWRNPVLDILSQVSLRGGRRTILSLSWMAHRTHCSFHNEFWGTQHCSQRGSNCTFSLENLFGFCKALHRSTRWQLWISYLKLKEAQKCCLHGETDDVKGKHRLEGKEEWEKTV